MPAEFEMRALVEWMNLPREKKKELGEAVRVRLLQEAKAKDVQAAEAVKAKAVQEAEAKAVQEAKLAEDAVREAAENAAARARAGPERCALADSYKLAAAQSRTRADELVARSVACVGAAKEAGKNIYELLGDDAKSRANWAYSKYREKQRKEEAKAKATKQKQLLKEQKRVAKKAATDARNAAAKAARLEERRQAAIARSDALREMRNREAGLADVEASVAGSEDDGSLSQTVKAVQKREDRKRFAAQRTLYKMLVPIIAIMSEEAGVQVGVYPAYVPKSPDPTNTDEKNTKSANNHRHLWRDHRDAHICITAPAAIFDAAFSRLPKDARVKYALWRIQTTGLPKRAPNKKK